MPFVFGVVSLVSGAVNILYFRLTRGQKTLDQFRFSPGHYVLAAIGGGLYTILLYAAIKIGPAGDANVLNYLWPTFIVVFTPLLLNQKLRLCHIAGLLFAVAGFCVLTFVFKGHDMSFSLGLGPLLALCGAVTWGLYSVLAKKHALPDHAIGAVRFLFGAGVMIWCALTMHGVSAGWASYAGVATLSACSAVTFIAWNMAFRYGDSASLGVLSYLTPVLSTLWLVVFGEVDLTGSLLVATLLVVLGAIVANYPMVKKVLKGENDV